MNLGMNLVLAAMWSVVGIGILMWPAASPTNELGIDPNRRVWLGGFTVLLAGYNLVRWRLAWLRQRTEDKARAQRAAIRPRHDEPPNPDFDFTGSRPDDDGPAPPSPG